MIDVTIIAVGVEGIHKTVIEDFGIKGSEQVAEVVTKLSEKGAPHDTIRLYIEEDNNEVIPSPIFFHRVFSMSGGYKTK